MTLLATQLASGSAWHQMLLSAIKMSPSRAQMLICGSLQGLLRKSLFLQSLKTASHSFKVTYSCPTIECAQQLQFGNVSHFRLPFNARAKLLMRIRMAQRGKDLTFLPRRAILLLPAYRSVTTGQCRHNR